MVFVLVEVYDFKGKFLCKYMFDFKIFWIFRIYRRMNFLYSNMLSIGVVFWLSGTLFGY